jgi:hypothetical protein
MSESMAFIGGVAVAGLAALLLLKGTNTPLQPNFAVTPQLPVTAPQAMQPPIQYSSNVGPSGTTNPPSAAGNAEQRVEMERMKMQLERFKTDNEQLKLQNQQLQSQVQNFTQQQWQLAQQANIQRMAAFQQQQQQQQQQQNPWWSSPIVWAVGGMSLTIGGGVVVAGVLALFGPKSRPTRTVQVIHPYNGSTPPLNPVRRTEFLPSRIDGRRIEAPEYDEMR